MLRLVSDPSAVPGRLPTAPAAPLMNQGQTLALMGDLDLPYRAVADQVASALDVVVHQARHPDGVRRVVEIATVGASPEGPVLETLVRWRGRTAGPAFEWCEGAAHWLDGLVDVSGTGEPG